MMKRTIPGGAITGILSPQEERQVQAQLGLDAVIDEAPVEDVDENVSENEAITEVEHKEEN